MPVSSRKASSSSAAAAAALSSLIAHSSQLTDEIRFGRTPEQRGDLRRLGLGEEDRQPSCRRSYDGHSGRPCAS